MVDREPSEFEIVAAFDAFLEDAPTEVRPAELADRFALAYPHRQDVLARWGFGPTLALAWALLLAGLLLALVVGGLVVGGWQPNLAVVFAPSPTPARTIPANATILATTSAKPLPAQAVCPPGSNPEASGPMDQDRPTVGYATFFGPDASMAFDRHAGRIVVLAVDERDPYGRAATWTYDVCANTWQRMSTADRLPPLGRLVYDADSDRTVAFLNAHGGIGTREIWGYDSAADRWTKVGSLPAEPGDTANDTYGTIFYHDPSGLIVVYDGATMWAYDVDTNTLTEVRQRPDPSLPAGSGLPAGKIALGYDPARDLVVAVVVPSEGWNYRGTPVTSIPGETWTFDPGTGAWRKETAPAASDLIVCGIWSTLDCFPTNGGRAVYDEASGLVVFLNRDNHRGLPFGEQHPGIRGRVDAFDAGERAWRTLYNPPGAGRPPIWCTSAPPVYDQVNRRIVCLAGSVPWDAPYGAPAPNGVSAFSTETGEWRWLLEPTATLPPAPAQTPIDWGTPPPWWEP